MTWAQVSSIVKFWSDEHTFTVPGGAIVSNTTASEVSTITAYLKYLYEHSATAATILDKAAVDGKSINIAVTHTDTVGPGAALPNTGNVVFNLDLVDDLYYFNSWGQLVKEKPELTVIHELIHALDGKVDLNPNQPSQAQQNAANFDHAGQTLPIQNAIALELGYDANVQPSYLASMLDSDSRFGSFLTDTSYYFGWDELKVIRLGGSGADTIDHSLQGKADLIFGLGGDDHILGGAGTDTLWGDGYKGSAGGWFMSYDEGKEIGSGADRISGGAGNDYIFGGAGNDHLLGDGGSDTIYGGSGDDIIDSGGNGEGTNSEVMHGGSGSDIIIYRSQYGAIMTGGSGNDVFRVDTTSHVAGYGMSIEDGDKGDKIFWNGYELTGGDWTLVDGEVYRDYYFAFGGYVGDHGEVYTIFDNGLLTIDLPDGNQLFLKDYHSGDFGLKFNGAGGDIYDQITLVKDANGLVVDMTTTLPTTNIFKDGFDFNYTDITDAVASAGAYGPTPLDPSWLVL